MRKIILIVLVISFLLVGCRQDIDAEVGFDEKELEFLVSEAGTVVLPLTKFNTLNPLINENEYYYYFSKLIFEGLFEFDNNLEPVPKLVEDFKIDSGSYVYIKLREDVLWHDGEEFTSSDVKFTIDTLKYGENTIFNDLNKSYMEINDILKVNIIDKYELEILFERESPNMLGLLTFPIVPEHQFSNPRMALSEDEDYTPIGTGPFKFESAYRIKDVNLTANEDYRFGKPRIEKIVGKVLDEDLFITSFEAGQIDITMTSQADWGKYNQNRSVEVFEFVSADYEFLGFNFKHDIFTGDKGHTIRKAINHALDIQNIIDSVYLGHACQVVSPLHPDCNYLVDNLNTYDYNPDLSIKYLENAGFKDSDGNGILEDENGNELKLRYLTNSSNKFRKKTAELIKNYLNDIGIELIFDFDNSANYVYNLSTEKEEWARVKAKIEKADFDIVQLGLSTSIIPDIGHLFHTNGSNNFINYSDEKMDSLISNYEYKNYNSADNVNLQQYIVDEIPYVSLFYKNKALLINSKIIGELKPSFYHPYNGLENCFTTTKRQ